MIGQEIQKLERHTDWVNTVTFSQDSSLLASASRDETVRLWNSTTDQEVQKLEGHTDEVAAIAFSQDGLLLASASVDKTVRLWDPATGQEILKLEGHTLWITAVAFSQDGSLLASASGDKTVRLWDQTTCQEVQKFENPMVTTISFTIDSKTLLTNRGLINIERPTVSNSDNNRVIMLENGWIQQNDYNILWLPQEYRSSCSAFYNNTFAVTLPSGQVSFIQLDYP
jgi:WD domain, G-beta repeat